MKLDAQVSSGQGFGLGQEQKRQLADLFEQITKLQLTTDLHGSQKIYEGLLHYALRGMNYGGGANFNESGEMYALKYIRQKLMGETQLVIFDVGANVGLYSRALSGFFDKKAEIHAFEPSKKTFQKFIETVSGLENIIPNNLGLSNKETDLVLYSNKEASGLASVYRRNLGHFGIAMDQEETIKLTTIDAYCKWRQIERVHFLKLDVEGHELSAMKGAETMINNNNIDFIQFEFGGCNIDSRTFFQDFFYLLKHRYRIYRILKEGLIEITHYKETSEIFITTNYLAERTNR